MKDKINFLRRKDKCVIGLVMFYGTKTKNSARVCRALSCVLYSVIENYFCIDYVCCHFKTLSVISSDKIFEEASYNKLLGIGIIEVLMNLISCNIFMENKNSNVILVRRSRLGYYFLEKGLVIIEHDCNQLSSVPNDLKLIFHAIKI